MAPILAYWDITGLAEQSRLLLKYLGVKYDEKQYMWGPAPTFDRSAWLSENFSLGLDFPNLPYYIDDDFKLTQSGAILEYIADKHGMIPDCKKQRAVLHMLQCEIMDLQMAFGMTCYSPNFEVLKSGFLDTLARKLSNFETYLEEKEWLMVIRCHVGDWRSIHTNLSAEWTSPIPRGNAESSTSPQASVILRKCLTTQCLVGISQCWHHHNKPGDIIANIRGNTGFFGTTRQFLSHLHGADVNLQTISRKIF